MIIDYKDNIDASEEPFANALRALTTVSIGLNSLFRFTKHLEEGIQTKMLVMQYGRLLTLDPTEQAQLECVYHWYSVSIVNYVRLVNSIRCKMDGSQPNDTYEKFVLGPEIIMYRNKVGAHFASAQYNQMAVKKDTDADRKFSVMPQITRANDRYIVGGMCLSEAKTKNGKRVNEVVDLGPWSLTMKHEELNERFKFYTVRWIPDIEYFI